jgi:tRNA A37 methylthiotransferase MiaB
MSMTGTASFRVFATCHLGRQHVHREVLTAMKRGRMDLD